MSTVKVVAQNFIKAEHLGTVKPLFEELISKTLKENGCIEYSLYTNSQDETHFIFVEEWETQDALKAHMASEHFTRLVPEIGTYASEDGPIFVLNPFK